MNNSKGGGYYEENIFNSIYLNPYHYVDKFQVQDNSGGFTLLRAGEL